MLVQQGRARSLAMASDFYLRYYVGHKGKFGHEFLEFEFRPDGEEGGPRPGARGAGSGPVGCVTPRSLLPRVPAPPPLGLDPASPGHKGEGSPLPRALSRAASSI